MSSRARRNPTSTPVGGLATQAYLGVTIGTVRVDDAGNLVVADADPQNTSVGACGRGAERHLLRPQDDRRAHLHDRRRWPGGATGDGGPGTKAALAFAGGVALDHAGNVVIADCGRIRVVAARPGGFTAGR